jgi:shikimate kinase
MSEINKKTSIALIGFMGAGKSAVGSLLAQRLAKRLVETDRLIEEKAGKPISRIFQEEGEIIFREREIAVIKEIAGREGQVIACGGGVPLNRINIDRLKAQAVIIWLTASPGILLKRTHLDGEVRPVLKTVSNLSDLRSLIQFRKPFYERAADLTINTSRLNVEETAAEVIKALQG